MNQYYTPQNQLSISIKTKQKITMKKTILFSLLAFVVLISSCKKDEEDARNKFLGTWSGTQTVSIPSLSLYDSQTYSQIVTVSSENANRIIVTSDGVIQKATVNGSSYTYDKFTQTGDDGQGNTMSIDMDGTGIINGNTINESGSVTVYYLGQQYSGTWSGILTRQ
jgi:hypothetical protein